MVSVEYQIKGSTIRSKLDFAQARFGERAKRDLEQHLAERGVRDVLDADWYPFALYESVLRKLVDEHFDGDLARLREVGAYSAERALSTTYEAYAARRDFTLFLHRISALHERFYSAGRLTVTDSGEGYCELELRRAPEISRADVHVAAGFYVGAARMMGLERARCGFSISGDRVEYRLDWS